MSLNNWVERGTVASSNNSNGTTSRASHVTATQESGDGPQTDKQTTSVPHSVTAEDITTTTVALSFIPPNVTLGEIYAYRVKLMSTHDGSSKTKMKTKRMNEALGLEREYVGLVNLRPDTEYTMQVSTQMEEDTWSEWSVPITGHTIADPDSEDDVEAPVDIDIGTVYDNPGALRREDRLRYLKHHYAPGPTEKLLTQEIFKNGRLYKTLTFCRSWLTKYPWLVYSKAQPGGFCKFCVLFPPVDDRVGATGALVSKPFTNLNKACSKTGVLETHQGLKYHTDAAGRAQTFINAAKNPEQTLPYRMSKQKQKQHDLNTHALMRIITVIGLCGKQNIPLRGHRDDSTSTTVNKGNFLAILELLAEEDAVLLEHLRTAKRNATSTSKTVQNEIISIVGKHIKAKLTAPLQGENAVFTIIADEVTDNYSNREILALCVRYVDDSQPDAAARIREVFLGFHHLERATGKKITNSILTALEADGVDIQKARGQCYDGAACMSSDKNGVHGLIKAVNPMAIYTHCNSHVLNLNIAAACQLAPVRDMIAMVNDIFLFFDLSPKRQRLLERVLEVYGSASRKRKLKGLCKTRWVERHTCFETMQELYSYVHTTLECITQPTLYDNVYLEEGIVVDDAADDADEAERVISKWNWDKNSKTRAQGLHACMALPQNIVAFQVARQALDVVKPMAAKLQKRDQDVYEAYQLIDKAVSDMNAMRTNIAGVFSGWYTDAKKMADEIGTVLTAPRITGRQQHRANAESDGPEDHYLKNLAIPFMDHIDVEMATRYNPDSRAGGEIFALVPAKITTLDPQQVALKLKFWEADMESPAHLASEIKQWKSECLASTNNPSNLLQMYRAMDQDIYPNLKQIVKIGCTLPISSSEAERAFSALRSVKSHLRSTMSEERLTGLSLMYIHNDIEIDRQAVLQTYIESHPRRMFDNNLVANMIRR